MAQWLDYRVRVTISDARMLVGQLLSFDPEIGVFLEHLSSCQAWCILNVLA